MVEKRLRKEKSIRAEVIRPSIWGDDDPELLFVCWGSSRGAVSETSEKLRSEGVRNGVLAFSQVWPLESDHFINLLEKAPKVVCVESNATGQLARLIRRETGFYIDQRILRYDGLPLTPEYIMRQLVR
jgi:2-oxoglutarate ferredoxin oxidoreductase subunit alpha